MYLLLFPLWYDITPSIIGTKDITVINSLHQIKQKILLFSVLKLFIYNKKASVKLWMLTQKNIASEKTDATKPWDSPITDDPSEARTPDTLIKSQVLYQLS